MQLSQGTSHLYKHAGLSAAVTGRPQRLVRNSVSKKTGMVVQSTGQLLRKIGVALVFQMPCLKPRDEDALS